MRVKETLSCGPRVLLVFYRFRSGCDGPGDCVVAPASGATGEDIQAAASQGTQGCGPGLQVCKVV